MTGKAEMSRVSAMDVAGGTNGTMSTEGVAAAEARAMDVVAETTSARDLDVGTETDATS